MAWGFLGYLWFCHSTRMPWGAGSITAVAFSPLSLAALVFGFLSLVCSLPAFREAIGYPKAWLFVLWCSVPFFLIVQLLDPLGESSLLR